MASSNGRIPKSSLAALPVSWSNKGEQEYLTPAAFASLSRLVAQYQKETGGSFQIYDAYRSFDEQVEMLKRYYTRASRGRKYSTDRSYGGSTWAKKSGFPVAASPGYSNHGEGISVDIYPDSMQSWMRSNAGRYGWVNDVPSESWHWTYKYPNRDQYKGQGAATTAPAPAAPVVEQALSAMEYTLDTSKTSANCNHERFGNNVEHITIHYWGTWVGQKHDSIVDYLVKERKNGTSAHYVLSPGKVTRIVPEEWTAWANGNRDANRKSITIELNPDPSKYAETIATAGALVRDIRSRWGDLPLYPHKHWTSTDCPGPFTDRLGDIDSVARGGTVSGGGNYNPSNGKLDEDGLWGTSTSKEVQTRLGVTADGRMGPDSWKALQRVLGVTADGFISHQKNKNDSFGNGISSNGWNYEGKGASGSFAIAALQRALGVEADGHLYTGTTKALQQKLNSDPNFLKSPVSVPAPAPSVAKLDEDGRWGKATTSEIQRRLGVKVDGLMGPDTYTAMQKYFGLVADGVISGQRNKRDSFGNGIGPNGWDYDGAKGKGSRAIRALQAYAGASIDGQLYTGTTLQVQKMLNAYPVFFTHADDSMKNSRLKNAGI